jgi:hypothetical protein
VLHENAVLEDRDLGTPGDLADDHHPLDGLSTREELGLADDRGSPAALLAAFPAALLLRLQAGRALDALHLVGVVAAAAAAPRLTDLDDGVRRVVGGQLDPLRRGPAPTAAPAASGRRLLVAVLTLVVALGGRLRLVATAA